MDTNSENLDPYFEDPTGPSEDRAYQFFKQLVLKSSEVDNWHVFTEDNMLDQTDGRGDSMPVEILGYVATGKFNAGVDNVTMSNFHIRPKFHKHKALLYKLASDEVWKKRRKPSLFFISPLDAKMPKSIHGFKQKDRQGLVVFYEMDKK